CDVRLPSVKQARRALPHPLEPVLRRVARAYSLEPVLRRAARAYSLEPVCRRVARALASRGRGLSARGRCGRSQIVLGRYRGRARGFTGLLEDSVGPVLEPARQGAQQKRL